LSPQPTLYDHPPIAVVQHEKSAMILACMCGYVLWP
jgi:hypothetical protein